jgi:hypothetical protein
MLDDGQGHRMAVLRKVTGIQKELEQDGKPQAVVRCMDRSNQCIFVGQEGEVFHQVIKFPVTLHGDSLFLSVVIFSYKEYYRGKTELPARSNGVNAAGSSGEIAELLGKIPGRTPWNTRSRIWCGCFF